MTAVITKASPLSRARLVEAALGLIDQAGLEAFSMRKLGAALGVEGMAVYHYFATKEQLLDAVAERLLVDFDLPEELEGDWIAWLRHSSRSYRAIAKRHPNAFPLLAMRRFTTPDAFRRLETFFRVLRRAGFDAAMTARIFRSIGYFVNGAGLADVATLAAVEQPDRRTPLDDFQDPGAFPNIAAVAPHLRLEALDGIFEFGLELLLAGLRKAPRSIGPASVRPRRNR